MLGCNVYLSAVPAGTKAAAAEAVLDMGVAKEHFTPVVTWFAQLQPQTAATLPQPLIDRLRALIGNI